MTDPLVTVSSATAAQTKHNKPNVGIWVGGIALVVAAIAIWFAFWPESTGPAGQTNNGAAPSEQVTGDGDAPTLDVDAVGDTADVPVEDADPNPVVPQDAVIPPAPVKDAPDQ